MKKSIEINRKLDPDYLDVAVSNDNGFSLEILAATKDLTSQLKDGINGFIFIKDSFHKPKDTNLNFAIDENCHQLIRIVGNLPEALLFLKERFFLSEELYSAINSDNDAAQIIKDSKDFKIIHQEETELHMPEFTDSDYEEFGMENPRKSSSLSTDTNETHNKPGIEKHFESKENDSELQSSRKDEKSNPSIQIRVK